MLHPLSIDPIAMKALEEDLARGDWTTDLCVPAEQQARARIIAKADLVVAGIPVVNRVFYLIDPELSLSWKALEGTHYEKNSTLLEISGSARSILKGERVALNFFAKLSGIASLTRKFVEVIKETKTQLLDTRKTTPGLRILEKYASTVGGAKNHRFALNDGILIKENHIRAAGGIGKAIQKIRPASPFLLKIEVEVSNLDEVKEALAHQADIIMLDNMSLENMRQSVALIQKKALIEASGNVTLENIRDIASTGVDYISTSAMFHSSHWADLSLLFEV